MCGKVSRRIYVSFTAHHILLNVSHADVENLFFSLGLVVNVPCSHRMMSVRNSAFQLCFPSRGQTQVSFTNKEIQVLLLSVKLFQDMNTPQGPGDTAMSRCPKLLRKMSRRIASLSAKQNVWSIKERAWGVQKARACK